MRPPSSRGRPWRALQGLARARACVSFTSATRQMYHVQPPCWLCATATQERRRRRHRVVGARWCFRACDADARELLAAGAADAARSSWAKLTGRSARTIVALDCVEPGRAVPARAPRDMAPRVARVTAKANAAWPARAGLAPPPTASRPAMWGQRQNLGQLREELRPYARARARQLSRNRAAYGHGAGAFLAADARAASAWRGPRQLAHMLASRSLACPPSLGAGHATAVRPAGRPAGLAPAARRGPLLSGSHIPAGP